MGPVAGALSHLDGVQQEAGREGVGGTPLVRLHDPIQLSHASVPQQDRHHQVMSQQWRFEG